MSNPFFIAWKCLNHVDPAESSDFGRIMRTKSTSIRSLVLFKEKRRNITYITYIDDTSMDDRCVASTHIYIITHIHIYIYIYYIYVYYIYVYLDDKQLGPRLGTMWRWPACPMPWPSNWDIRMMPSRWRHGGQKIWKIHHGDLLPYYYHKWYIYII